MNLRIQTLDDIDKVVKDYVVRRQKFDHPTIHGVYGYVRGLSKYSYFGDYPLLQAVLVALKELGEAPTPQKLLSCIKYHCDDLRGVYRGKQAILKTLFSYL